MVNPSPLSTTAFVEPGVVDDGDADGADKDAGVAGTDAGAGNDGGDSWWCCRCWPGCWR